MVTLNLESSNLGFQFIRLYLVKVEGVLVRGLNLSKEELQLLLNRAWEIEKYFESLASWKGYITVDSSNRKMLLSLLLDSEKHRVQLEQIMTKLNFPIPTITSDRHFSFQDKYEGEILT